MRSPPLGWRPRLYSPSVLFVTPEHVLRAGRAPSRRVFVHYLLIRAAIACHGPGRWSCRSGAARAVKRVIRQLLPSWRCLTEREATAVPAAHALEAKPPFPKI